MPEPEQAIPESEAETLDNGRSPVRTSQQCGLTPIDSEHELFTPIDSEEAIVVKLTTLSDKIKEESHELAGIYDGSEKLTKETIAHIKSEVTQKSSRLFSHILHVQHFLDNLQAAESEP